jgi:hypothetical protein
MGVSEEFAAYISNAKRSNLVVLLPVEFCHFFIKLNSLRKEDEIKFGGYHLPFGLVVEHLLCSRLLFKYVKIRLEKITQRRAS